MTATHLAITVELVGGMHAPDLWPRPGRVLVAARRTTFRQLASAIDDAFARSHLHQFVLADGTMISPLRWWNGDEPEGMLDGDRVTLSRLTANEQFAYIFDLGDDWAHLCTVGERRIDPLQEFGTLPDKPLPFWGWGAIPDQYGRRWQDDDGVSEPPPDPLGADLPPILPDWEPRPRASAGAAGPKDAVPPPELHVRAVRRYCASVVPERVRDQVRVEVEVAGNTVTIVERRVPWGAVTWPEWTRQGVAQLRYIDQEWHIYWADRDNNWLRVHDLPATKNIEPQLGAITANHNDLFWL